MNWLSDGISLAALGLMALASWQTGHALNGVDKLPMQWNLQGGADLVCPPDNRSQLRHCSRLGNSGRAIVHPAHRDAAEYEPGPDHRRGSVFSGTTLLPAFRTKVRFSAVTEQGRKTKGPRHWLRGGGPRGAP